MFILSLKSFRGKLILLVAVVVAAAVVCTVLAKNEINTDDNSPADSAVDYSAETEEERKNFIAQTGCTVESDPVSVTEILIPSEFDEVYTQYNEVQKQSGFNLSSYTGCTVKKWTYQVTNYPEYENSDAIRLTILVYKGEVIGGDICSVEIDGFMHGLFE